MQTTANRRSKQILRLNPKVEKLYGDGELGWIFLKSAFLARTGWKKLRIDGCAMNRFLTPEQGIALDIIFGLQGKSRFKDIQSAAATKSEPAKPDRLWLESSASIPWAGRSEREEILEFSDA